MEFLLLWADELDDALAAFRHLAPKLLATVFILTLMVASVFALMLAPHPSLVAVACALCAFLLESVRRRQRFAAADRDR